MAIISPYLLIITLNVNELNSPIKRHRMTEWIKKKKRINDILPQRDSHFRLKDTQAKREDMKIYIPSKW